jgi:hypothetical protein
MALPRWRKLDGFAGLSHETARLSTILTAKLRRIGC